ncbi:hypothetical protein [Leifsonia sp. NPDC077715]|uniref:hypothetical protein n=1 Tax=Leifsonia sp. NPDC077715 TaxID=3155539 RepID=UPI0034179A51
MADEIITRQQLIEASLDAECLQKFISGTDIEDVLTRLGMIYPTLAKLVRLLMETGGWKAYVTEAVLLATVPTVNPSVGYAFDTKKLYLWNGTIWKDEGTSPLDLSKKYTDSSIRDLFADYKSTIPNAPIIGYAINATTPQDNIFTSADNRRAYLRIDVKGFHYLVVDGSINRPEWKFVYCDINNKYISTSSNYGNGTFAIPTNAKWAYRTWKVGDLNLYENDEMVVTAYSALSIKKAINDASVKTLYDAAQSTDKKLFGDISSNIVLNAIQGFSVQTSPTIPAFLSPQAANDQRAYIKIDVSQSGYMKVSNTLQDPGVSTWLWVFETSSGGKIITSYSYDVEFDIPDNVIYAYRTVYYSNATVSYDDIANGMKVVLSKRTKVIQPQIDNLVSDVEELKTGSSGGDGLGGMPPATSPLVEKMLSMFKKKAFISPNDFADATQTDRIKSAVAFVKTRGYGIIELGVDKQTNSNLWTVTEAITLPSNCWIYINKSTVKRGNGVFDNIFRNEGIVPDPNPFNYATALNQNENILIFGNTKADSFIDGNLAGAKVAPHPVTGGNPIPWISDFFGWRAISILFANTQHHHVFNLSLINSQNWTISNEHGCSNFSYHDLYFNTTVKNGDGVNVRFGCHDFEVYNIDAKTSDDTVACNSLNNFITQHPSGQYTYPTQVGGYADRGFGIDVHDGEIYNINASSSAGVGMYFSGGSKIYNINVNNVKEFDIATVNWLVHIQATYGNGATLGDCYNITINDIDSKLTDKPVFLNAPLKDVWVNKVTQSKVTSTPAVSTGDRYVASNVKITNVQQAT